MLRGEDGAVTAPTASAVHIRTACVAVNITLAEGIYADSEKEMDLT